MIENASERFERVADDFYRETGYIAPGKSVPAEMDSQEYDARRREVWAKWVKEKTNK